MASGALFPDAPFFVVEDLTTANAALDGTGSIVTIKTGSAAGTPAFSLFSRLRMVAKGATLADSAVRLFLKKSGGSWKFWREFPVGAVTPNLSASPPVEVWSDEIDCTLTKDYLALNNGDALGAATVNGDDFTVFAWGGDTT